MVSGFSSLQIAVQDLDSARSEYSQLLGAFAAGPERAALPLSNIAIELLERPDATAATITGLTLWAPAGKLPADRRSLPLALSRERTLGDAATATGITGVDHIVLRSRDADDCIRLFKQDLGMRLALDQAVPEWGGRMLFFRCGKLTLEVIQHLSEPVEQDYFWGITYLCSDLDETLRHLDAAGVAHSERRDGRKPGTFVATVKSHHLGLPTLLIQPAAG